MRHFLSLVVVFMVCTACKAVEPQKIAVSELAMKFTTKTEQIHSFYGAGDFVANVKPTDCDEMYDDHVVLIKGDRLTVDAGTEYEEAYRINSCTYSNGKVFSDKGTVEVYYFSCNEIYEGKPLQVVTNITVQKVKDGARRKTIISIPSCDSDGVLIKNTILKD